MTGNERLDEREQGANDCLVAVGVTLGLILLAAGLALTALALLWPEKEDDEDEWKL